MAILEDDQLVEMQVDRPEARRMVGDIYWGKVDAVLPGIQAAFVDIGTEKAAFLHASDLVYDEGDDDPDDDEDDDADEADAAEPSAETDQPDERTRRTRPRRCDRVASSQQQSPRTAARRRAVTRAPWRSTAATAVATPAAMGRRRPPRRWPPAARRAPADSGRPEARPVDHRAGLQGADLDEGAARHRAGLHRGPLRGLHAVRVASRRQPQDRRARRAPAPARAGAEGAARRTPAA